MTRNPNEDLFQAVLAGDLSAMRSAFARGASPHAQWPASLDTPLHMAASRGHELVAGALIEAGANPNACNFSGRTPLHEAALRPTPAIWDRLIDAGANDRLPARDGMTPTMIMEMSLGERPIELSQAEVILMARHHGLTRSR